MSRAIAADGARAGALLIERSYREGDGMQFLRELSKNGFEAGATKIQFGIHWNGVNLDWSKIPLPEDCKCKIHPDRYRMVYYDNGCGMGHKMSDYMAGLLDLESKDQTSGDPHGNFGMGARVSILPWNKAGVIIASWSNEVPDGQIMWIHYVPDSTEQIGYYEAMSLEWDEDGEVYLDEVAPAEVFPEFIDDRPDWLGPQKDKSVGTGSMFLLLGDTGQEHTFLGPEGTWNTHTGPNYLTHRYWKHSPNLTMRYEDPRSAEIDSWHERLRDRFKKTNLSGPPSISKEKRVLNEPVRTTEGLMTGRHSKRGTPKPKYEAINMPQGGRILVHLLPESEAAPGAGRRDAGKPGISILYHNELYHHRDNGRDYLRFAIAHAKIYQRLSIIIQPRLANDSNDPEGGVIPTSSRTSLHYIKPKTAKGDRPAGRDLPWNEWQELFVDNMPKFVQEEIDSLISDDDDTEIDKEIIEQIAEPFMNMFRYCVWSEAADGDIPGVIRSQAHRRKHLNTLNQNTKNTNPNPAVPSDTLNLGHPGSTGNTSGKDKPVPMAIPDCRFDSSAFSEKEKKEKLRIGVKYIPGKNHHLGEVIIDESFPIIHEVKKYWTGRFAERHFHDAEKAVKLVYATAMACRVGQLFMMAKKTGLTDNELISTFIDGTSLTASLYGLASEHAALKQKTSGYRRLK